MNALDKLQLMFRQAEIDVVPTGLSIGLILTIGAWLFRALKSSTATLWSASFGDGSPIAFNRQEEPREYWALVVLAFAGFVILIWIALDRLFNFTNTAP